MSAWSEEVNVSQKLIFLAQNGILGKKWNFLVKPKMVISASYFKFSHTFTHVHKHRHVILAKNRDFDQKLWFSAKNREVGQKSWFWRKIEILAEKNYFLPTLFLDMFTHVHTHSHTFTHVHTHWHVILAKNRDFDQKFWFSTKNREVGPHPGNNTMKDMDQGNMSRV